MEHFFDQKPPYMSLLPLQRTFRILKHEISSFFPLLGTSFGLPGSGSADPIESGPNPDPKHCFFFFHATLFLRYLYWYQWGSESRKNMFRKKSTVLVSELYLDPQSQRKLRFSRYLLVLSGWLAVAQVGPLSECGPHTRSRYCLLHVTCFPFSFKSIKCVNCLLLWAPFLHTWIRIRSVPWNQCWGFVSFCCGSGSADLYLWIIDLYPDPTLDPTLNARMQKRYIFSYFFL